MAVHCSPADCLPGVQVADGEAAADPKLMAQLSWNISDFHSGSKFSRHFFADWRLLFLCGCTQQNRFTLAPKSQATEGAAAVQDTTIVLDKPNGAVRVELGGGTIAPYKDSGGNMVTPPKDTWIYALELSKGVFMHMSIHMSMCIW